MGTIVVIIGIIIFIGACMTYGFGKVSIICIVVVGGIVFLVKMSEVGREESDGEEQEEEEQEEEERRRLLTDANEQRLHEFQTALTATLGECRRNRETSGTWELKPTYEAVSVQMDAWNAIDEVSVPLQRLEDIVSELKALAGK